MYLQFSKRMLVVKVTVRMGVLNFGVCCSFREHFLNPKLNQSFWLNTHSTALIFRYTTNVQAIYIIMPLDWTASSCNQTEIHTEACYTSACKPFLILILVLNLTIERHFESLRRIYTHTESVWTRACWANYNEKPINKFYSLITIMKSMPMKMEQITMEEKKLLFRAKLLFGKVNAITFTDISCDFRPIDLPSNMCMCVKQYIVYTFVKLVV